MAVVFRRHPLKAEIIGSNPVQGTKRRYRIGPGFSQGPSRWVLLYLTNLGFGPGF